MAGTNGLSKILVTVMLLATGCTPARSQHLGIDTAAIKSLIHEWNFANNTRSVETFRNVYGEELLFYTERLDEDAAVRLKQEMFEEKPGFRQNIASGITFTAYTSGVVKCDFIKEVWERSHWKKYPSYLLVSYDGGAYEIVGESDHPTDRVLKYDPELGEPMELQGIPQSRAGEQASAPGLAIVSGQGGDTPAEVVSRHLDALLSLLPPGLMVVPKRSVYIFMGLLLIGGALIFMADALDRRRTRRRRSAKTVVKQRNRAEEMVAELNTQSVFEAFVVTLFDPILFRHRRPEAKRVYAGEVPQAQPGPDLEFVYQNKGITGRFAIKCLYFPNALGRRWQFLPPDQLKMIRSFVLENEMELYYIVGIGGTPDDPMELYLVPGSAVKAAIISRDMLRPFAKSGMVYYHRKEGRLR